MQNKVSTAELIKQPFIIVEREGRISRLVAGVVSDRGGGNDGGEGLQERGKGGGNGRRCW